MEDQSSTTPAPRGSKFMEGTMNSTSSIHPPPDMLWGDLGIDELIERFHEDNKATPARKKPDPAPATPSTSFSPVTPAPASEGTFGRFSRVVASLWHGSAFSALGKRKAGSDTVEKDDRKEQAEQAYKQAKELGLLPAPKVFVRPHAKPRKATTTPSDSPTVHNPRLSTPMLHKSASKKDLNKQKKLSKRVSNLEYKLAEARKELNLALALKNKENANALTPVVSTPTLSLCWSENEVSPHGPVVSSSQKPSKVTKKRKASGSQDIHNYKSIPTEGADSDMESEPESKKSKTLKPKRSSRRLSKKNTNITKEEVVIVVPDGVTVPPIPSIPKGVDGKRAAVSRDDGFGGLGHEIF